MKAVLGNYIDLASAVVLIATVVLFAIAAFEKGLTHDLLLEAGVFLISIKLVLSTYKTNQLISRIDAKLDKVLPTGKSIR